MLSPAPYYPTPRSGLHDLLRLGDAVLDEAMQRNQYRFRKGRQLASPVERQERIFRLVTGSVARMRHLPDGRRQIICLFTPGDLIPARAILVERVPDTISLMSDSTMTFLPCASAISLAERHPEVAFRLMWQIGEDERRLRDSNVMLGKGTAKERVCMMIADLLARKGVSNGGGFGAGVVFLRQQDIADLVGLTVVHVNRTLRLLREEGAIRVAVGAIKVLDADTIFRYAASMLGTADVTNAEKHAHVSESPELSGKATKLPDDVAERIEQSAIGLSLGDAAFPRSVSEAANAATPLQAGRDKEVPA